MKIRVSGIKMHAFHGVFEEERKKGTQFVVDLCADVLHAPGTDDLSLTVDYQAMYRIAVEELEQPVNLLETLAQTIAKRILASETGINKIQVRVHKLKPLRMPLCAETSVEVTLEQSV